MALTKWLPPTHRRAVAEDQDRVTWLELFFDLVYVAALIQLGDELSSDVTWAGVGRFIGIFTVLWWTWTTTTGYINLFAVDDIAHRMLVFVQMFAVANIALLAVGPNDDRWAWLAVAYVAARVPLLIMYRRVLPSGGDTTALARIYITSFSIGAGLFALSIVVDEPMRFILWGAAIAVEFATPLVATGKLAGPPSHEHHLRERYAIFAIIVFGETFVKTLTELAERGVSIHTQVFGGLVFVTAVALWWTYFDDIAESNVRQSNRWFVAGWVYGHLPLTAALTAFGVGSKKIVDIESFDDAINEPYLWLFSGSVAIALIATAGLDLVSVSPHFAVGPRLRTGARLVAATAILLVAALLNSPALLVVAVLATIVIGQIAAEVLIATKADAVITARIRHDIERSADGCNHLSRTPRLDPPGEQACSHCVEQDRQWVELRHCQVCGHVGCCDDSSGQHARKHWQATEHPVMATIEHGAEWAYCFAHDATEDPWLSGSGTVPAEGRQG